MAEPDAGALPGSDLLFVVPCRNEAAHISSVLDALHADEGAAGALIVVVDGESEDATRDIVAAYPGGRVRLLENPKRLQSSSVNLAARTFGAGRAYMVRVDAHAGYPPDYGSALRRVAEAVGADSVVVPMRAVGRTCFGRGAAAAQNSRLSNGGSAHRVGGRSGFVDHGHHALMRLDAFLEVGGYDEGFVANEDAELDQRLTRAGRRIYMAGDVGIDYYPRDGIRALLAQYGRHGEGRARTLRRHRARPRLRQLLPALVAPAAALALLAPLQPLLAVPALLWCAVCLLGGTLLAARSWDACALAAGPAAMAMHLGWSIGFWRGWLGGAARRP